jgi:hypothetical protein
MRLLRHGFAAYLQHRGGNAKTPWKKLIRSRLTESTMQYPSLAARMARERAIALEINAQQISTAEKVRLWKQRTRKSGRALHRRLKDT